MSNTTTSKPIALNDSLVQRQWKKAVKSKYLLLLILPGFVWYIIFRYIPMYGIIIAFKNCPFAEKAETAVRPKTINAK